MKDNQGPRPGGPRPQYLSAEHVLGAMCHFGSRRLAQLSAAQIVVLAMIGGAFITMGALFSVLLSEQVEAEGFRRLLQGLGFSTGFFFVVLSEAVLFTEANVMLPAVMLYGDTRSVIRRVARFWTLAWIGNLAGAFVLGWLLYAAQDYHRGTLEALGAVVEKKMHYRDLGTPVAWLRAMLSGVLANWLVGMAAFFATMGRTIFGKYVPVALAVSMFVAAGVQHSPANMGYFALAMPYGGGPGWLAALAWNIVPVGIGNMIGGAVLVALPFYFALRPEERAEVAARASAAA